MQRRLRVWSVAICFWFAPVLLAPCASAERARIGVAANFEAPAARLIFAFEKTHNHEIGLVTGSTGQLFAQIKFGAPLDVFLAADRGRPERLAREGFGLENTRQTYALGRLVLWSRDALPPASTPSEILRDGGFRRIALANPELAPYGAASVSALQKYCAYEALKSKLVRGQNIGQAFAMTASGNAEFGFAALSQIKAASPGLVGDYRVIDPADHIPIRQDMILLNRGADNPAARAFITFMRSPVAQQIIADAGYDLP